VACGLWVLLARRDGPAKRSRPVATSAVVNGHDTRAGDEQDT